MAQLLLVSRGLTWLQGSQGLAMKGDTLSTALTILKKGPSRPMKVARSHMQIINMAGQADLAKEMPRVHRYVNTRIKKHLLMRTVSLGVRAQCRSPIRKVMTSTICSCKASN